MIKKLSLVLAASLALLQFSTLAQSMADINSPKIMPPSPDAAALGKYGQIPVDKSTGIPSISIPLYEIKTPRFSLPISLSYHASGVKVDEIASWVGLGWSLNAGGVITRSMVGLADDYPYYGFLSDPMVQVSAATLMSRYLAHDITDSTYIVNVSHNIEDSQPDNFFYNFANQSGGFVYNKDNTKIPTLIPYKPLKITINTGVSTGQTTFTIVDEGGNTYLFNNPEFSSSNVSNGMNAATSWYLTQMISADKSDTIKFYYTPPYTFIDQAYSFSQNLGPFSGTGGLWPMTATVNQINGQQIYIDSIVFKGGRVDFKGKTGRSDNGALSLDSVIVSNYDFNVKKYSRLKSFKIGTDYFYSSLPYANNWVNDPRTAYRLRLSSLTENDKNNTAVKTHQFTYNGTPPPTHNFGQDKWGFYNGKYNNQSLLEADTVISHTSYAPSSVGMYSLSPIYYIIGSGRGADRSVNGTAMQYGMLQKITYPTGGSTVFTFEPNQGQLYPSAHDTTVQSFSIGAYHPADTIYFIPQAAMFAGNSSGSVPFHVQINATTVSNGSGGYYYYSNLGASVTVMQGTTALATFTGNSSNPVDNYFSLTLTAGTQYKLISSAIGGSTTQPTGTLPQAHISTAFYINNSAFKAKTVAFSGLRVKSIKSYDISGSTISTETYKYGVAESGLGTCLTNPSLNVNYSVHLYAFDPLSYKPPIQWETTYSNSSVYPLSNLNGSPMAYPSVTIYHGDTLNNIGKSIYNYAITSDSLSIWNQNLVPVGLESDSVGANGNYTLTYYKNVAISPFVRQGIRPVSRSWQNGEPIAESDYLNIGSGQYILQRSKTTIYNNFFRNSPTATFISSGMVFFGIPENYSNGYNPINNFTIYDYAASSGSRQPIQSVTTTYGSNGTTVATTDTVKYYYDNLTHMLPTRILSYDGKGDSLLKKVMYPQDMVNAGLDASGIYAAMTTANIISPVIQFTEYKNPTQSTNGTQLEQSVTNYTVGTTGIINPQTVSLQVLSNPAETRLSYQNYDTNNGNLLTVSKQYGAPVSYIWGYKGAYPVAEVKNAAAKNIFFESFEDGHGNTNSGDAKTGHYSYLGAYSHALSLLDNSSYVLTYWLKSGTVWTLTTTNVTVSTGSYTISLNGQVDDIRFYPAGALMTTYTYDPLIGVTSVTDQKGEISYYEYDALQRLSNIRDQYKNIIKSFCYNYAGQSTSCFINQPSYSSALKSGTFTKSCAPGSTGSAVTYTVPAGAYTSNISQADADSQAQNDVNTNGQNYANLNGGCTSTAGFTMTNYTGVGGIQVTFYGSSNYTYTVPAYGSSTVQVPTGTYYSMTVGSYGGPSHTFTLGTRTPVTYSIAGFSNVNISAGSSDLSLSVH